MAYEHKNTGSLIEAVKNYPVLYDTNLPDHRSNKIKNEAWDCVAKSIGDKNGDKSKNKWKNLRDAYIKHLRTNNTDTGQVSKHNERYRTWPWSEPMAFLRPFLDFLDEGTSYDEPETKRRKNLRLKHALHVPEQNTTQFVDRMINLPDFDDIDLVFLGYAKTIKKMSKNKQARVKFQIAQLVMEAELEEDDPMLECKDFRAQNHPECIIFEEEQN